MLKLPFKTSPKQFEKVTVGSADIGELELPKYSDLSPNERIFIKENTANIPDIRNSAIKIARTIATKSGQRMVDVYNALVKGDSEYLGDYLEEFVEFQRVLDESSEQRNLVMATAIIKHRLLADWELENTGDASQIHPLLVAQVTAFARNEESGWAESTTATEDDLGNSTTTSDRLTGEKSSGESSDTAPATVDSAQKTLDTNQPG